MGDADLPVNWCLQNQAKFPCNLTAFNAAFIGAIASLAGGIMVVCLNMRVCRYVIYVHRISPL